MAERALTIAGEVGMSYNYVDVAIYTCAYFSIMRD